MLEKLLCWIHLSALVVLVPCVPTLTSSCLIKQFILYGIDFIGKMYGADGMQTITWFVTLSLV